MAPGMVSEKMSYSQLSCSCLLLFSQILEFEVLSFSWIWASTLCVRSSPGCVWVYVKVLPFLVKAFGADFEIRLFELKLVRFWPIPSEIGAVSLKLCSFQSLVYSLRIGVFYGNCLKSPWPGSSMTNLSPYYWLVLSLQVVLTVCVVGCLRCNWFRLFENYSLTLEKNYWDMAS